MKRELKPHRKLHRISLRLSDSQMTLFKSLGKPQEAFDYLLKFYLEAEEIAYDSLYNELEKSKHNN